MNSDRCILRFYLRITTIYGTPCFFLLFHTPIAFPRFGSAGWGFIRFRTGKGLFRTGVILIPLVIHHPPDRECFRGRREMCRCTDIDTILCSLGGITDTLSLRLALHATISQYP